MTTRVYRYGLLRPTENRDEVHAQLRRAHAYRNTLTEIERGRRAAMREAESAQGELAVLERALLDAQAVEQDAADKITRQRASTRSRSESDNQKESLKVAREATKAARKALTERRKVEKEKLSVVTDAVVAARHGHRTGVTAVDAYLVAKAAYADIPDTVGPNSPIRQAARDTLAGAAYAIHDATPAGVDLEPVPADARRHAINARASELRRSARAHCGIPSGTYLLVEEAADASHKSPLYDGTLPNDPRFSPYRGEGSLGVQLGGIDAGDVFEQGDRLQVAPVDERAWYATSRGDRRRSSRTTLKLQIGIGRNSRWAAWPMVMHRPMPEKSVVKRAAVHVRKIGPREEWWVTFTVTMGEGTPRTQMCGTGVVAVDIGWRQFDDGTIRVAMCGDADGNAYELRLSPRDVSGLRKTEDLRSIRDKHFDAARDSLVAWLKGREVPAWLALATETLAQWKSQARLAALAKRWAESRFFGDEEAFGRRPTEGEIRQGVRGPGLEGWRYHDYHLWTWETSQRTGALRQRREVYRVFAAQLARKYATIVLEDFNLKDIAERPKVDEAPENETARSNRQLVAVSEFRLAAVNAFTSRGGVVAKVPAAGTTITCHVCGVVQPFDAAASVTHACECGVTWDQDINAYKVMLAVYGSSARDNGPTNDPAQEVGSRFAKAKRKRAAKAVERAAACSAAESAAE